MAISVSSMASFLLLVSLSVFLTGPSLCDALVGGKSDIPNVKSNKEVQDLGSWCVSEYNSQQHRSLTFKEVTSGQQQVVAGMNYYLHIQTVDGGATKYYDAVVWVRAWLSSKQLLSFQPAA
ncbi:cysteine proteinase inhibitor A-like [Nymphaea colorata]|uniref:Cystatin domain-containing protein n=1 Tax=Nymphaea colorata TaxID=210225 RepID=A0A5K1B758_9MAGN|nr:cysteine proteinase inhibitor A-like [Nymphaea colorata]